MTLTRDRLQPLLGADSGPCVSIYMPTHGHYGGTGEGSIRFKNALREARRLLLDRHSSKAIRELLDPVAALSSADFWRHQAGGLAVFRSPDLLEQFRVAREMPELVVVADSFHVRPLIRCLDSGERYFLIAISRNGADVFEGTASSLTPLPVSDLPKGLAQLAASGRTRGTLGGHAARGGFRNRSVHAAGAPEPSSRADLVRFFRAIDRAVRLALRGTRAPVILAGVDYYLPLYREVSRLKGLADAIVSGSPDAMTLDELHARAWPVAQGVLRLNEDRALDRYRRAAERGRSSEDLEDVMHKARGGRVRCLFLALGLRAWGTVDPATGRVRRTPGQQGSRDDDLLDDVAEAVLLRGGEVRILSPERMPLGLEVAAELR